MDMRATQSPIESTHNTSVVGTPPKLGTPTPGTTGGLPAVSGLSVLKNPMAQQLQSMGRGQDSMLVHMTPEEVNSLQGLAMAHGGSLTINPHTGLPEAGWLGKLLPMLLGGLGMLIPGAQPWMLGLAGAAGGTAATGDLRKGLLMGLGAFGGASLAGGLGVGAEAAKTAATTAVNPLTEVGVQSAGALPTVATPTLAGNLVQQSAGTLLPNAAGSLGNAAGQLAQGSTGILSKISAASKAGLPSGILQKAAPYAAGMGVLNTVSEATAPNLPKYTPEETKPYVPMGPGKREVMYQSPDQMRESGGAEFTYFTPSNPAPVPLSQLQQDSSLTDEIRRDYGYADGGLAALPTPQGFNDLVNYFGATNPGAVTASMYPTSAAPAQAAAPATPATSLEKTYNFSRTPTAPVTPATPVGSNYVSIPGFGDISIPAYDYSNVNWDDFAQQYGYIPQSQQIDLTPVTQQLGAIQNDWRNSWMAKEPPQTDLTPITDQISSLKNDWRDSWMAQQEQPAFDPNAYDWSNVFSQYAPEYEAPDLSGVYNRLDQLQSQIPSYEAPDLSGIYGRLDQLQNQIPSYEAPDLSGIQSQLSELQNRQYNPTINVEQQQFDPNSYDWSSVFSQYAPKYEAPDLSGIYGRLDQLQNQIPSYEQPDLSGIYGRLDQLQSQIPTYQAPDLSGIYDRFGNIESQLQSLPRELPTYQQPDLSSIYDRFGAIESQLQSLPRELPTYQQPDLSGIYSQLDQIRSMFAPQYESGPAIYDMNADQYQTVGEFAEGGTVNMRDGSFVVDARTVSELGNGSSNAGKEILARMGGRPLDGPGDGVSDSIPARIGGSQKARVARDEVIMPPEAVRRIGGGSEKRGTQKLYALMDKAHKARKTAKRGQDTKLAKGLGALA